MYRKAWQVEVRSCSSRQREAPSVQCSQRSVQIKTATNWTYHKLQLRKRATPPPFSVWRSSFAELSSCLHRKDNLGDTSCVCVRRVIWLRIPCPWDDGSNKDRTDNQVRASAMVAISQIEITEKIAKKSPRNRENQKQ